MIDEAKTRERAYALWEQAGRPEGTEREHWLQAREQLEAEQAPADEGRDTTSGVGRPGAGVTADDE
ncbi:hypothetical protein PS627_00325 [Pseudomonas fluorescens]|uniref:DUF2934 domain-containing protein n=1 Tax=Pseudomonas fluorescens TaxID=294 RepID=UPI001252765D|nr:DUF2934 domain-containing protein [Pseudomonas fluorescens]CAG8863387.1 hypothetical protein PS627_00325 [Pseudomonas fluorescens]VVQ02080.1 hypothetical protein PS910_03906 [Pseudomonas fluorescens]